MSENFDFFETVPVETGKKTNVLELDGGKEAIATPGVGRGHG